MAFESPQTDWRALGQDLKASLSRERHDFTSGPIGRAILLLAIPMVLEMSMQAVFEVVDVFFVGRLGAESVAAVGLTAAVLILVFAVGIGIAMAVTAMVARRIGEDRPDQAARATVQGVYLSIGVSVPVAFAGVFYAPELLRLMGGTDAVVETGTAYFAVLFGSNIVVLLLFLFNAAFRGAGDAPMAMRALWLANGINIVMDPLLIFGLGPFPEMGVTGAAVATVLGRGIGVAYQIWILVRGKSRLHIRREHVVVDGQLMRSLLRITGPGVLQYLIGTAGWLGIMRIVAVFGSIALAGYTIAVRVIVFAMLPSWGMGNAAATLVGQNLGAGKPDRAERSVWYTAFTNVIFLLGFTVLMQLWAVPIMRLFTPEQAVIAVGAECLRIVSYSYPLLGFGVVLVQAFNGSGDTTTPTYINFATRWLAQIPLAYVLAVPLDLGTTGVFAGIAISQVVMAGTAWLLFRRGTWKLREV